MGELELVIKKMRTKGDKESVIEFLKTLMKLIPPTDDIGISLAKKGTHEYILDRKGLAIISLSEDEYLPFFSASEKRVELESLPDEVAKNIKNNWRNILDQLRDYVLDYSKIDKKYLKVVDEITDAVFKNL
jgi:hypothetical protein